ncbi:hypothetical protein ACFYRK_23640 [Streptomyces sp. NPDC005381]|uniref:hypothetical protein n=1 Tax=Streptomyces sp. NPDC005381 TaxID=3364714 RepID=UPI00367FA097
MLRQQTKKPVVVPDAVPGRGQFMESCWRGVRIGGQGLPLSRGGDRAANAALYRMALTRMARDQRTREYVTRQTDAGRTKTEIIRLPSAPLPVRSSGC